MSNLRWCWFAALSLSLGCADPDGGDPSPTPTVDPGTPTAVHTTATPEVPSETPRPNTDPPTETPPSATPTELPATEPESTPTLAPEETAVVTAPPATPSPTLEVATETPTPLPDTPPLATETPEPQATDVPTPTVAPTPAATPTEAPTLPVDDDGDGVSAAADCDDQDKDVFPGASETCNNQDDNCDGNTDEGFDSDDDGTADCKDTEECDGLDNDGDTLVDEGFDSDGDGTADCKDTEECDGVDNDGDTLVDEGFDSDEDGTADCKDTEECDDLDNNGDGVVDEGFDSDDDGTADCFDVEECDELDNNGDGVVDEGFDSDDDGLADCFDVEECDTLDNDGDGQVDESPDLDGDGICDDFDADPDGDHVIGAGDPDPLDGSINAAPHIYFYMPAAGWLYLYAPAATVVDVKLNTGSGYSFVRQGLQMAADTAVRVDLGLGTVMIQATTPVLAFYVDDQSGGDQATFALAADGTSSGTTLYTWAAEHISVSSTTSTGGEVIVSSFASSGGWTEVSRATLTGGESRSFGVTGHNVYRVESLGGEITAYGMITNNALNMMTYLSSGDSFQGQQFRYIQPEILGQCTLLAIAGNNSATFSLRAGSAAPVSTVVNSPYSAFSVKLSVGVSYELNSTHPSMSWVECDPNNGATDTTILDVDLVPGVSGGMVDDTYLFRTSRGSTNTYTTRFPDIDVLGYADETSVTVTVEGQAQPFTRVIARGERWRVITNAAAAKVVQVQSSQLVSVSLSHDTIGEFAGTAYTSETYIQYPQAAGGSCDPDGVMDFCTAGYTCSPLGVCVAQSP